MPTKVSIPQALDKLKRLKEAAGDAAFDLANTTRKEMRLQILSGKFPPLPSNPVHHAAWIERKNAIWARLPHSPSARNVDGVLTGQMANSLSIEDGIDEDTGNLTWNVFAMKETHWRKLLVDKNRKSYDLVKKSLERIENLTYKYDKLQEGTSKKAKKIISDTKNLFRKMFTSSAGLDLPLLFVYEMKFKGNSAQGFTSRVFTENIPQWVMKTKQLMNGIIK